MKNRSPLKQISYHHNRHKSDGMINETERAVSTIQKRNKHSYNDFVLHSQSKTTSKQFINNMQNLLEQLNKPFYVSSAETLRTENAFLKKENYKLQEKIESLKKLTKSNNSDPSLKMKKTIENQILKEKNEKLHKKIRKLELMPKKFKNTSEIQLDFYVQQMIGSMKELVFLFENSSEPKNSYETMSNSEEESDTFYSLKGKGYPEKTTNHSQSVRQTKEKAAIRNFQQKNNYFSNSMSAFYPYTNQ